MAPDRKQLLAELEDVLETMPPREAFERHDPDTLPWPGRASAALRLWDPIQGITSGLYRSQIQSLDLHFTVTGLSEFTTVLHQAVAALRMEFGRTSVTVQQGQVHAYFEQIRKIIGTARSELFFVDAYLGADFVDSYLPFVRAGVVVRLLGTNAVGKLVSRL